MRVVFIGTLLFGIAMAPISVPAQTVSAKPPAGTASPKLAPVDEVFGRYGQSVLEIRNRISEVAFKSDPEIRTPAQIAAIDYAEDGAIAWAHKYPDDPWLAKALSRLVACYARAGAAGRAQAIDVLTALGSGFPRSYDEGVALLALWQAPPEVADQGIVSGRVVADATGAPVAGAIVMVAPNQESTDLGSTPFTTTGVDGSFSVADVPIAPAEYIVVEPPRGSSYAVYHGKVAAAGGTAQAGVIRLAVR